MKVDSLLAASETLMALGERFRELPEQREDAMQAALWCGLAANIASELALHLSRGVDPYEALLKTAQGTELLSPQKATLITLLSRLPFVPKDE
jgi:hypothetical protein